MVQVAIAKPNRRIIEHVEAPKPIISGLSP